MKQSNKGLSTLFWLNKQRSKNGKPAMYLRCTLDYARVELATHLYLDPTLWNARAQQAKPNTEQGAEINRQLSIIKANLNRHYARLLALEMPVTAEK